MRPDISPETEQARASSLNHWKKRNCQPSILYPAETPFKNKDEIRTFSDI